MTEQTALIERSETLPVKAEPPTINIAAMFERLAANPEIPVDKLQALMDMQRTILREQAEQQFNAAMAQAQAEMRPVAADATNPQTRSRYATYEALDRKLRPIYTRHGFALSFDTAESPMADHIRVLSYVTHGAGHQRTYKVDMPADGKGAKGGDVMTKTHAAGAAMSYGMRYLLKMVFNVAVGEDDDDGNGASRNAHPAPAGYEEWATDIRAAADNGMAAFEKAWRASKPEFRTHLAKRNAGALSALRELARKAGE